MSAGARIRITRILEPDELGAQIEPHMAALANAIGVRAQRLVPKRTWALHDTISANVTREGARIRASVGAGGGKVDYALYVERGTSRAGAQPFLRPALSQSTSRDLAYSGGGIRTHGVSATTRRTRLRKRSS